MFHCNKFFLIILLFTILAPFASCSFVKSNADKQFTDTVIAKDTMVLLLIDIHLIEGIIKQTYANNPNANLYNRYYFEQVLQKYNANTDKFKSSIRYYTQHSSIFDQIYEEVITKLNEIHNAKNETGNLQDNKGNNTDSTQEKPVGLPKIFDILKSRPAN